MTKKLFQITEVTQVTWKTNQTVKLEMARKGKSRLCLIRSCIRKPLYNFYKLCRETPLRDEHIPGTYYYNIIKYIQFNYTQN